MDWKSRYCYAMLDGKSEIYEISEDVIEILNMSADSFSEPDGDVYSYLENIEEDAENDEEAYDDTTGEDTKLEDTTVEDTTVEDTTVEDTITEE